MEEMDELESAAVPEAKRTKEKEVDASSVLLE